MYHVLYPIPEDIFDGKQNTECFHFTCVHMFVFIITFVHSELYMYAYTFGYLFNHATYLAITLLFNGMVAKWSGQITGLYSIMLGATVRNICVTIFTCIIPISNNEVRILWNILPHF